MERQSFCVCCGWRQHALCDGWMDAHPWYFIWPLSYLFCEGGGLNQQRLSSGQSLSWQSILPSSPSDPPPLPVRARLFSSKCSISLWILCYFQSTARVCFCTTCARFTIIPGCGGCNCYSTSFQKFASY